MIQAVRILSDERRPEIALLSGALVLMALCCTLPFALLQGPASVLLLAGVLGTQLLAYMACFRLQMYDHDRDERARWHDPRPIYAITVAGALFAMPASLTGTVDLDVPEMPDFVFLLLVGAITVLLGRLGVFLVWFPVELLVRGVSKVAKGEREGGAYLLGAAGILVLVGFAVAGASAVDTSRSPSQPGFQGEVVAALLGVPGDYTVTSPAMLVAARVFGATVLLAVLAVLVAGVVAFVQRIVRGLGPVEEGASGSTGRGGSDDKHDSEDGERDQVGAEADGESEGVDVEAGSRHEGEGRVSASDRGKGWTGKLY